MAIKALFPHGLNSITVSGLYQWDYGQVLEIESADLGSIVAEVHFACSSMSEAIVKPCAFSSGAGTVTIPDECLEQSSTITAWIYEIAGTQGRTRKVLSIPVTARMRPSVGHDIPTEITDQYTELITEINEAIDALENGNVIVEKAKTSEKSDSATTAGNASTANYAVSAGEAIKATNAICDKNGDDITTTYVRKDGHSAYSYTPNGSPTINSSSVLEIGSLPIGKNADDIVGVGIEVFVISDDDQNGVSAFLKLSSGRTSDKMQDRENESPTDGGYLVPFTLTGALTSSGDVAEPDGFGVACIDVRIGSSIDGKVYIHFDRGSCWFYNPSTGSYVLEILNGRSFSLRKVYYWFA